ncbi:MAG: hypothetical protein ACRDUV_20030 [Pseudonocardiaceae bacterium]
MSYLETAMPEFPTLLAHHVTAERHALGAAPAAVEALLIAAADRRRRGVGWAHSPALGTATEPVDLVAAGSRH